MLEFRFSSYLLSLLRLLYIAIALSLLICSGSSCTAQKRLNRLCRKNPNICKRDTTWNTLRDTLIINSVSYDTLFKASKNNDTIIINKDRLTVKYFYNAKDSTVYLSGNCDSAIKYIEIRYPQYTQEVTIKKTWIDKLTLWLSFIGGAVFVSGFAWGWVQKIKNNFRR